MAFVELFAYLFTVAVAVLLAAIGVLSLGACIWLSVLLLSALLLLAWLRFDGGRHPCFLFLAMLLVFQGGRLVGYLFGSVREPLRIELATLVPLSVSTRSALLSLLIVAISAICVYFPCRVSYRNALFRAGAEVQWLTSLYVLVALTFPFALYKNLMYIRYLSSHGGYLAVFTDNAAVLQSAGPVARILSMICANTLLIAFALERQRRRIALLLTLLLALSALDLVIGFRGKVFTELLSLWLLHNLKTGKRFTVAPVAALVLGLNLLAVAVAAFRESSKFVFLNPIDFLAGQGVSLNVTEAAIEFRDRFGQHGARYILGGFAAGIDPPSSVTEGQLWTDDLTMFLNPTAAKLGFGTASSYLAELYLFAGFPAIVLGSLAVGYCLAALHRVSVYPWGAVILGFTLPSLIYLPRLELLNPLAVLVKSLLSCTIVFLFACAIRWIGSAVRWKAKQPLLAGES